MRTSEPVSSALASSASVLLLMQKSLPRTVEECPKNGIPRSCDKHYSPIGKNVRISKSLVDIECILIFHTAVKFGSLQRAKCLPRNCVVGLGFSGRSVDFFLQPRPKLTSSSFFSHGHGPASVQCSVNAHLNYRSFHFQQLPSTLYPIVHHFLSPALMDNGGHSMGEPSCGP